MTEEKHTVETVTWIHTWVPGKLFSFRTTRHAGYRFTPGQFARLGIRRADPQAPDGYSVVWRAYSMVSASYDDYLEFYSIVVPDGLFTSELERLHPGDEIFIDKTAYGFLTTERFEQGQLGRDLWMLSSGTGIAPFVSILQDPQVWHDYDRLIIVHSVRTPEELVYRDVIEGIAHREFFCDLPQVSPDKLFYVPVVTRGEPQPGMLHQRITTLIEQGDLERAVKRPLMPEEACVMLCGNPEMVTDTRKVLSERGFRPPRRGQPGNLAVENYW